MVKDSDHMAQRFEDLRIWQSAKDLALAVYREFNATRDFGLRDQIQRAVFSISNNIAEGYERGTDKELRQFLYIAKGSCGELRSMLIIAQDLGYNKEILQQLERDASKLGSEIGSFITVIQKRIS